MTQSSPLVWFLLFLAAGKGSVGAQEIGFPDWGSSVYLTLDAPVETVSPGEKIVFRVRIEITPGYHIYGPEEKPPNRTELLLKGRGFEWGAPSFPPVLKKNLAGLGEYDLFEGDITITIPAMVSPEAVNEIGLEAEIEVKYQVCTDGACSPPTSETLRKTLGVSRAAKSSSKF